MHSRFLLHAALLASALPAAAQQAMPQATHAQTSVPDTPYESVFRTYRPFKEADIAPWRETNDAVGRVGGHAGIFRPSSHGSHDPNRQASPPAEGQPPAQAAPKAPAMADEQHGGHK
jgi:hypothetical protein